MKILALDMAKATGWAHACGDSGVQEFEGKPGVRWAQFALWLREMADVYEIGKVVYEKPHHRGYHATHQGHVMVGVLEQFCVENELPEPVGYHTATIKKHATGSGRAGKPEMLEAARVRNPDRDFIDHNEIDALFLLDLALGDV